MQDSEEEVSKNDEPQYTEKKTLRFRKHGKRNVRTQSSSLKSCNPRVLTLSHAGQLHVREVEVAVEKERQTVIRYLSRLEKEIKKRMIY